MPESIEIDRDGNLYVSLSFSGEIRKIAPDGTQTTVAVLPIGPPLSFCGVFFNAVGPITLDKRGNLYASVLACDADKRGVWKIAPDRRHGDPGHDSRSRACPTASPSLETICTSRTRSSASSGASRPRADSAEAWLDDPLLKPAAPGQGGANGLQVFRGEILVANSSQGTIVAIPVRHRRHGRHPPRLRATAPAGLRLR